MGRSDVRAPAEALAYIDRLLPDLDANDLLDGASPAAVRARISIGDTLEQTLAGAVHVQESTPEDVAVKRSIFARLDATAPATAVLASSTSAILPSLFTENAGGPGALPGRASDQPALSHSGRRGRAGALDRSRPW